MKVSSNVKRPLCDRVSSTLERIIEAAGTAISNYRRLLITLSLCAWTAFNLASLTIYPTPYRDDSFFSAIALQFLRQGNFGFPLAADMLGTSESIFHLGRIFVVGLALFHSVAGFGLFQARLYVFIGGLMSAWLTYRVGASLWGKSEGGLSATILLLSWHMFWSSHSPRPDTWINAAGMACLLFFLHVRNSQRLPKSFLLGLFAFVLFDLHLKSLYYVMAVSVLMLATFGRKSRYWCHLIAFGSGALLSTIYWLAVHFLPDPRLMLQQWFSGPFSNLLTPSSDVLGMFRTFASISYRGFLGSTRLGWLDVIYLSAGAGLLLWRRSSGDNIILLALSTFILSYILFTPGKSAHHAILFMPLLSLAAAAGLAKIASWIRQQQPQLPLSRTAIAISLATPLLVAYLAGDLSLAWRNRFISAPRYNARLAALVPPDSNVLGEDTWWWRFRGGTFTSDLYFSIQAAESANREEMLYFIDAFFVQRPVNVVLIDNPLEVQTLSYGSQEEVHSVLLSYVQDRCDYAGAVEEYFYGVDRGGPTIKRTEVFLCTSPGSTVSSDNGNDP